MLVVSAFGPWLEGWSTVQTVEFCFAWVLLRWGEMKTAEMFEVA
jgi:hypothetical protein